MKSVLITGAGGFLGSHLCEKFYELGYNVIGVDNFSTGSRENLVHLKSILSHDRFQFFESDVVNPWTWKEKVNSGWLQNLKYVFHFASPASPPLYQKLAVETIHVNTIGLENAIQFADQFKARVIFASTSEVYGDPSFSPQPESYWGNVNSFGERSCYDEGKRCGEAILFSYNKKNNTRHGLVRIFNTYGPRMNPSDGRVVINFLVQALKNQSLTLYGDGLQTRSFCYVDDLVAGIISYAEGGFTFPINIGNPTEFTVLQLAETVKNIFPEKNLKLQFEPLPQDDPKQRKPDISLALREFKNWKPEIPLAQGLKKTLSWLQAVKTL